jgi:hypothetical protein
MQKRFCAIAPVLEHDRIRVNRRIPARAEM